MAEKDVVETEISWERGRTGSWGIYRVSGGDRGSQDFAKNLCEDQHAKRFFFSAPAALKDIIAATFVSMLSAPLQSHCPNLSEGQRRALKELKQLQKDRKVALRLSDKAGGW